jgi:SAM-dependent methyltransferase
MSTYLQSLPVKSRRRGSLPEDAFSRIDEENDAVFYARDRFVSHLDSAALATVEEIIGQLFVEDIPVILDLMASWDSHVPSTLQPGKLIGLGLNDNELSANEALSEYLVQDLNATPELPFPGDSIDAVICTVSVEYLTRPWQVFREVGRVLKPGGLFLVTFSNRFFPSKSVKIWRECREEERVLLVPDFFEEAVVFERPRVFVSRGRPRPKDDKYAYLGIPSDPVYAVYAEKRGGLRMRPTLVSERHKMRLPFGDQEIAARRQRVKETLRCPYCDTKLEKWQVPDSPFIEWPSEFQYVCFNDGCAYFAGGWSTLAAQGNFGSYRFMYDPPTDGCHSIAVLSDKALRDGIVESE